MHIVFNESEFYGLLFVEWVIQTIEKTAYVL